MRFLEFRIANFRSIVDTGWCQFSPDGATVLVGQNESGKTSILAALATTFQDKSIEEDDVVIGAPLPVIQIKVEISFDEVLEQLQIFPLDQLAVVDTYITSKNGRVDISFVWERASQGKEPFDVQLSVLDEDLSKALHRLAPKPDPSSISKKIGSSNEVKEGGEEEEEEEEEEEYKALPTALTCEDVAAAINSLAPEVIFFEQKSGLLPDRVDVIKKDGEWQLDGEGAIAAANFLAIAEVTLEKLVNGDGRTRQNLLNRANSLVTANFSTFWSQTIGKKDKLDLKCGFEYYGPDAGQKAGKPHLVFWISDGLNHLYPKQRSTGVRWFVSFYLQLKASDKNSARKVFLLDEPGANLHSKAQADVLRLINQLSGRSPIIYSTHSPHMVEYDKLYRVLAVQRSGQNDDTPTSIIHAHKLGAASRDTLSPVLMAMGADLSHQQVIQRQNNVILEEISGFYYLKAFWKLTKEKQEAHFIAATGASNVESLANMFLGWGLDFIIAVDDDQAGRSAYNDLKRHMFGDDDTAAKARMLKIDGRGIEDIFDKSDFTRFVLCQNEENFTVANSQHVKDAGMSKPVIAYQFWIKVESDVIKTSNLSSETKIRIRTLVDEICSRLKKRPKN